MILITMYKEGIFVMSMTPLNHMAEINKFFKRYRFLKRVVLDALLELVEMNYRDIRGLPIPIVLQLLTTLRLYATLNFQVVYFRRNY